MSLVPCALDELLGELLEFTLCERSDVWRVLLQDGERGAEHVFAIFGSGVFTTLLCHFQLEDRSALDIDGNRSRVSEPLEQA
jgi:hypothetical protein